ncbi:Hpt domain-containing protein [Pseudodesulfovibrio portus]|uniref:Histidine phosphotransfer domain-containing protein n=1 Tax=Pseudodesulfovibrio portus TaxID=231439 RepID=A0ABN6RWI4_9BACT|nr:Hpt domain-containing protein [Pseudodesulfovibrio portus]BDQ34460.1 histidine phosphotransfer domain-containing protein [Pseudodesulfovibrio portus]
MSRIKVVIDPELQPIMGRYMEIRREEQDQLEAALAARDPESVRQLGHKLKGTGASFGFDVLTEWGAAIEMAGRDGDLDRAAEVAAEVRRFIDNVDIVYGQ